MRKIASTENICHAYDAFREFLIILFRGFPDGAVVKNLLASARDTGEMSLIPGWGSSPGEANGNPLQYFCLENLMDRGACWAPVHGVATSLTWLKQLSVNIIKSASQVSFSVSSILSYSVYISVKLLKV